MENNEFLTLIHAKLVKKFKQLGLRSIRAGVAGAVLLSVVNMNTRMNNHYTWMGGWMGRVHL